MKLYANIKLLLKALKSNFLINITSFLLLPLILGGFMGMIEKNLFENPINIDVSPVIIIDEDNSIYSDKFLNFIDTDLKELVEVTSNKDDASFEIIIPKNYENSIINQNKANIKIKKLSSKDDVSNILSNVIDAYHEQLYFNENSEFKNIAGELNTSSINTSFVKANSTQNSYAFHAITFLGFMSVMFINNNALSSYMGETMGLNKRINSLPVSRFASLCYETFSAFLYAFIFIMIYIIFYRALGIAFKGNFSILILISAVTSLFISCASNFIYSFFPKKFGQIIVYLVLILQVLFGGMLNVIGDFMIKFSKFNPVYLINEMYTNFSTYNNLSSVLNTVFISTIICIVLFALSAIKEKYFWREF